VISILVASIYAPQWYYLETEHEGGVRNFLKCRTFGLCMAHNRLLGFHVVRSTRPVVWTPTDFVPERSSRTPRPEYHLERYPQYPEPHFFLNHTGKYFFRNDALRGLRLEQYNRYWATVEEGSGGATLEDTCCEEGILPQAEHKDYDQFSESVPEGQRFASSMKKRGGAATSQSEPPCSVSRRYVGATVCVPGEVLRATSASGPLLVLRRTS